MHFNRMRTVRCSGCLSCHRALPLLPHTPPYAMHPPCMPPAIHALNMHASHRARPPPSVDRMTDTCENITFPKLLLL